MNLGRLCPPSSLLSCLSLGGMQFHQLTSRWKPSLTKPQDWASVKKEKKRKKQHQINTTRSSLQSDSALKLLVVLSWRDVLFFFPHKHTSVVCALPPDYISHQPLGLKPTSSETQLSPCKCFFFHVISRICECDDTRTHVSVSRTHARVCACICVVLVFTIE